MVYVINQDGQPIMPTTRYGKVRRLLKQGKAKVVNRCPFIIKLLYESTNHTQDVTLGVDTGIKHIGIVASTEKAVLYQAETLQRTDVSDNVKTRRELRRSRRNRKTRYRKPRFLNRVHTKQKGWLAPSVEQLIGVHLSEINHVCKLLPIAKIIIETAEFDIHKIKNPDVQGIGYQYGEKYGFEQNTRNYILWRDNHKCRNCGRSKSKLYVVNANGKDTIAPEDLYALCQPCFEDYCKGGFIVKKKRYFAPPTKMGIMRDVLLNRAVEQFPDAEVIKTTGAETKAKRETLGIDKSHINDAFCIANNLKAKPLKKYYLKKKVRCHNRQIHKNTILKGGYRKANQAPKYVFGYQIYDKVLYNNQECFIFGRRSSGSFDIRLLDGTKLSAGVSYKKLKLLEKRKSYLIERRTA